MKFGLHVHGLHSTDQPPDETFAGILEQVRTARERQFDLVWVGQHFVTEAYQKFQPIPAVARMAAETGDMHLGMNLLLPLLHPVVVSEQLATIDALSGGRTVLSPIAGYRTAEFDAMGVSLSERGTRLAESVRAIKRLWTEDSVTFEGRHFSFEDVTITPKPIQNPRPPIWIGATAPPAVERAGELGDSWFISPSLAESTIRSRLDLLDEPTGGGYRGLQPALRRVFVAETDDAAREVYGPAIEEHFDWQTDAAGNDLAADVDLPDFEELMNEGFVVGSPETVADGLVHLHENLGIDCVVMSTHRAGVGHEHVLESIRLTGDRVVPAVRERLADGDGSGQS